VGVRALKNIAIFNKVCQADDRRGQGMARQNGMG